MLYSRIQSLYQNSIDRVEDLNYENIFELKQFASIKNEKLYFRHGK
jgi:hypothetical protein